MKRLLIVIGLAIVIITTILGGMIMYKVHEENVFKEKVEAIISDFDEKYNDSEEYEGTRYDKEDNMFIVRFKSDTEAIDSFNDILEMYSFNDILESSCKKNLKEASNSAKERIKDDFELDCDVKFSYDDYQAISD